MQTCFRIRFLLTALTLSTSTLACSPEAIDQRLTTQEIERLFQNSPESDKLAVLTQSEMRDTEGAAAPFVAVGVMAAGRFIAQRWVHQKMAASAVQNAVKHNPGQVWGVMANTRAQAANIAGRGGVREFHPGPGQRWTHYHNAQRDGTHVWYGRPRP